MNTSAENVQTLVLEEILDISSAEELKASFLMALENKMPVRVDARNVDRVDTTALQLMGAFVQDAKAQAQSVQWQQASEALQQSATLLGLQDLLAFGEETTG